ncbi:serine hydrolase [Flavobacterium sp. XGLA_31]|uniref:serine hydrolase n=1 Tax=Flavobacterium sp. XGLA_31 TaxID=3447666 RepID=UPI003F2E15FF
MISLKNKQFSLLQILVFTVVTVVATFFLTGFWKDKQFEAKESESSVSACNYNIKRMNGFKFIKPLMFVDEECESDQLNDIKQKVIAVIEKYKSIGDASSASVYLREYGHNEWMSVNDTEKYDPGSLFKVPVLMAILKMNELNPGFLNKKVTYSKPIDAGKMIVYPSKTIKVGETYTIRELLNYMIKYSDNAATILVENNMDSKVLQKLFSDIGLDIPNIYATEFKFTTREYSYFMRAIYNAGYLNVDDSEYAGELLSQCDFKDGILKGLPEHTRVAHKFGESGNQTEKQLHESGIVYLDNKPYLLTIMTKGKDFKKLSQLVGEISQTVYAEMASQANSAL